MVDASVVARSSRSPRAHAVRARRSADLGLSPADVAEVRRQVAAGCEVLGLRYLSDGIVGTRFETLRRALGERFLAVEFDGDGHSTLTEQPQQAGVDAVLEFFGRHLRELP